MPVYQRPAAVRYMAEAATSFCIETDDDTDDCGAEFQFQLLFIGCSGRSCFSPFYYAALSEPKSGIARVFRWVPNTKKDNRTVHSEGGEGKVESPYLTQLRRDEAWENHESG